MAAPCMAAATSGRSRPSAKAMTGFTIGCATATTRFGTPSLPRGASMAATTLASQPHWLAALTLGAAGFHACASLRRSVISPAGS